VEMNDLSALQTKLRSQYSSDGMLETLLGCFLVLLTIMAMTPNHHLARALPIFFVVLLGYGGRLWKKSITYPRLGYAKLKDVKLRQARQSLPLIFFAVLALVVLFLFGYYSAKASLTGVPQGSVSAFGYLTCLFFAVIIAGAAFVFKVKNLYWIGGLLFVLLGLANLLALNPAFPFGIAALASLILGILALRRFLRENPVLEGEAKNE
jgi:hypothetical protein